MFIIRPATVDDTTLVSSTVAESEAVYNPATSYAQGAIVRGNVPATAHRTYESLAGSNTGNPLTDATKWLPLGSTNRWKMFNKSVSAQTENATSIVVVISPPGRVDTIAFHNVDASSIRVRKIDAVDGVVFDETRNLVSMSGINNLFRWLFEPIVRVRDGVFQGLGVHANCQIEVTISAPGGTAKCGFLDLGQQKNIGSTQYGATVGVRDFSLTEPNVFGEIEPVERPYAKRASFTDWMDAADADQIQYLLAGYRAVPLTCVGSPVYGSTILLALINFNIDLAGPNHSLCTMELKGLI